LQLLQQYHDSMAACDELDTVSAVCRVSLRHAAHGSSGCVCSASITAPVSTANRQAGCISSGVA
jgi:hypothetical protein